MFGNNSSRGRQSTLRHHRVQNKMDQNLRRIGYVFLLAFTPSSLALGGDWPQVLGPQRNGSAVEEAEIAWPAQGPQALWQQPVGQGLAGVAVVAQRLYLFHRLGDEDVAEARSAATGEVVWKRTFPTQYASNYTSDAGPRCVPLVHGNHLVLYGASGRLGCLDAETGQIRWTHDTAAEFDAPDGYFGAGSSPVVHEGMVIVNVGAREKGIVAFRLEDGAIAWSIPDEAASYSSPIVARVQGEPRLLCITRLNFLVVNPTTGEVISRIPFGARGPTVNAATPLLLQDHVFLTASYGVGARWISLRQTDRQTVWSRQDVMSSQYTTCVEDQGILYGIDGRDDVGAANLRAIDPMNGEILWEVPRFGMAVPLRVNHTILLMKTDGELVAIEASRDAYRERGRATLTTKLVRALPAYANGRFCVRDTDTLHCFQFGAP